MEGMHEAGHGMMDCNGGHDVAVMRGSWHGHVIPGIVYCLWGVFIALNVYIRSCKPWQRKPQKYSSWYPIQLCGFKVPVEPILKVLVPVFAMATELYWDHESYRRLQCPKDSKFAGRFDATTTHNWQHALNYPGFILSGVVDIVGMYVTLPDGLEHTMLGGAHAVLAFLMWAHKKHVALDAMVHEFFDYAAIGTAAGAFAEAAWPTSFMIAGVRPFFLILQGTWLMAIARIMHERHAAWTIDDSYSAPLMIAPVVFVQHALCIAACMFAAYVCVRLLHARTLKRSSSLPTHLRSAKSNKKLKSNPSSVVVLAGPPVKEKDEDSDSLLDSASLLYDRHPL